MIKAWIAKNAFLPLHSKVYRKDKTLTYYQEYKKAQWNTHEQNKAIQRKNLFKLLTYAKTHIPYYKKALKNIKLNEKTIFEDIKQIPFMTKSILKNNFTQLQHKQKGIKSYENSSGGSTGEPVRFVQDYDYHAHAHAYTLLQYDWANYSYGENMVKLWGSYTDVQKEKDAFINRFANWMRSVHVLDSFLMTKKQMNEYVAHMNKLKPKMILAYAHSLNDLAQHIQKKKLKVHSPKSIITSAGILYPEFRKNIEKTFKAPVFNRYGSREVGNVACECEEHKGLHVNPHSYVVEILDEKGNHVKEGENGHIYITTLDNYTMPLIRYKIGDMATYTKKQCPCKRGFPIIKNVLGRDMDTFITEKGDIVQGIYFIHYFGVINNTGFISKFQLLQKKANYIEIKVVIDDEKEFNIAKPKITKAIQQAMGKSCKIKFRSVKDIPPTKSGKYRYTIREC